MGPSDGVTGLVVRGGTALPSSLDGHLIVDVRSVVEPAELGGAVRTVVVGDPDAWQRGWRVLDAVRDGGELLIDAGCASDYRALTGDRELPPYCTPGAGRGWLIRAGTRSSRMQWMPAAR